MTLFASVQNKTASAFGVQAIVVPACLSVKHSLARTLDHDRSASTSSGIASDVSAPYTSTLLLKASPLPLLFSTHSRLLAVLRGETSSHLVVGTLRSPVLQVFALPSYSLILEHTLSGMSIMGIAGDPLCGVLAVCDGLSGSVFMLPWPLPGMVNPP